MNCFFSPLFLPCLILLLAQTSVSAAEWTDLAATLNSESPAARDAAIRDLKKTPELDLKLRQALRTQAREPALLVIRSLARKNLVPALLEDPRRTEDWSLLVTLNSLMDEKNQVQIANAYSALLPRYADLKPPVTLALLDGLSQAKAPFKKELIEALFDQESHEVRIGALRYAKTLCQMQAEQTAACTALLKTALRKSPYQLRLAALYWLKSLPRNTRRQFENELTLELADQNEEVRALSEQIKKDNG